MNKIETFEKELKYIKDESLIKDAKCLIENLPDYFFEIPAASTGKYHPTYAAGTGGLLRHTKAATRIGYELLNNPLIGGKYTFREKDIMLLGLIIHDGLKCGITQEKYTRVDHPLLVANYIKEKKEKLSMNTEEQELLSKVVASHMGPWNKDFNDNEVLPIPKSKYESFVHMCDYLSSKKFIKIEFDKDNNIVD